jgi:hypothetical protein
MVGNKERASEIDFENLLPLIRFHILHRSCRSANPSIVYQHVYSTKLRRCIADHVFYLRTIADIT